MPGWSEEQSDGPTVLQHMWRSETKDCRGHWKIRWEEECLRTIRSLGPARGPGQLKPQLGRRVCCRILGREPGWAVWEARCLFGPGGLNRRNFSKRKRENRGTQQLFREFSTAAVASCAPTPSGPGLWTPDKQPQHTPEAQLVHTPLSGLGTHTWNPGWVPAQITGLAA